MDIEVSRYESSKQQGLGAHSSPSKTSTNTKKKSKKEKKAEKKLEKKTKQERRISESSSAVSETSFQRNQRLKPVLRKNKASTTPREQTKRKVVAGQERKSSLADKWHRLMDEYEGAYVDSADNKGKDTDEKKVGKLTNLERFDNVKQVFGVRGVPIPVHAVSTTNTKLKDMESESATSIDSAHSWGGMKKARKNSQEVVSRKSRIDMKRNSKLGVVSKRSSTESSRPSSLEVPRRSSSEVAHRHAGMEMARLRPNSPLLHPESPYIDRNVHSQNLRKASTTSSKIIQTRQLTQAPNPPQRSVTPIMEHKKKTKKTKGIDSKAADIVENVIDKALDFLYGTPKPKRRHGSQNVVQNISQSSQRANVYDTREVYNAVDHRANIANGNFQLRADQRKSLASSMVNGTDKRASFDEVVQEKRYSLHPMAMGSATRPKRPSVSPSPPRAYPGSYDLAIGSYGAQPDIDGLHSPQVPQSDISQAYTSSDTYIPSTLSPSLGVRKGSAFKFGTSTQQSTPTSTLQKDKSVMYSSDSEYSTTLEIRNPKNKYVNQTNNADDQSLKKPKKVQPPTLTKGTVTRILHEVNGNLKSSDIKPGDSYESEMSYHDYSTHTWPLAHATGHSSPTSTTNMPGSPIQDVHNIQSYATLPHTLQVCEHHDSSMKLLVPDRVDGNMLMAREQYIIKHSPINQNGPRVQHVSPSSANNKNRQVELVVDTSLINDKYQNNITHSAESRPRASDLESNQDLPPIQEVDENQYAAFSNEPIIVADVLDRNQSGSVKTNEHLPGHSGAHYIMSGDGSGRIYGTQPAVSMNKKQTLNFFVFNQTKPESDTSLVDGFSYKENTGYISNHVDQNAGNQYERQISHDTVDDSHDYDTEYRKYLIYHKQTQTPSVEDVSSKVRPQKANLAVRKQVLKQKPLSPAVKHKETTHYITKERQVEKIMDRKPVTEMACQTDYFEDKPEETMNDEDIYMTPVVTEPQQLTRSEDLTLAESGREIKVQVQKDTRPNFLEVINAEIEASRKGNTMEIVKKEEDPESEEETQEMFEIEEKEQKIGMAIFEELEFHTQRTQGGKTVSQSGKTSSESTPIEPFWLPGKFEAVVDRRKQKKIQVKEMTKSGEDSIWREKGGHALALTNNAEEVEAKFMDLMPSSDMVPKVLEDTSVMSSKVMTVHGEESNDPTFAGPSTSRFELGNNVSYSPDYGRGHNSAKIVSSNSSFGGYDVKKSKRERPEVKTERYTTSKTVYLDGPQNDISRSTATQLNRSSMFKSQEPAKFGSLKKSHISFPDVPSRNMYQDDTDTLPESLDHFDQMVTNMERELPRSPVERYPSSAPPPPPPPPRLYEGSSPPQSILHKKTSRQVSHNRPSSASSHEYRSSGTEYQDNEPFRGGSGHYGSRSNSLQRQPSKFEPDNVSFGKKSGVELMKEANEYMFKPIETIELSDSEKMTKSNNLISGLENEVVHSSQSEPKLETKIVKDKEGNLMKVTELKHTLTKTREFDEPSREGDNSNRSSFEAEQLGDTSYIDMDLFEARQALAIDEDDEALSFKTPQTQVKNSSYIGPEVMEETTIGLKPYELEAQQWSLRVADDGSCLPEQEFLYNINTAKLTPKTLNGIKVLDAYETMSTEL